jgi:hypothetical protein
MNKGKIILYGLTIISIILGIGMGIATNNGYEFNIQPEISEGEIVAYDIDDATYINDNFESLVTLFRIQDIQPPKECFSTDKCSNDKKDVETWCASIVYGIIDTSFIQVQAFCTEVSKDSKQVGIEDALKNSGQKTFDNLKLISPPVYIIDQSNPLIGDEYDYSSGQWNRN